MRTWYPEMIGRELEESSDCKSVGSTMTDEDDYGCMTPTLAGFIRCILNKFFSLTKPIIWPSFKWMHIMNYWQLF
ncbi:hypothetical protein EB796_004295 [Bugula neritina]|uniref:Uncharacterized protein n=1 Tax=Bugula neritina TaxID=10212 RepID=A0A7J7KHK7_BUGNE|nr:hypothetical protein EB796_025028 [Bugula neritina]KAF6037381.1 hypothetical protein EB796_004295 [Bugula neritina]